MSIEALYPLISFGQRKMIDALIAHPEGLRSDELAEITGVSNKSGTLTPDVRELLLEHGWELSIKREKGKAKWVLRQVPTEIILQRKKIVKLNAALEQIIQGCETIQGLLGYKQQGA